MAYYPDSDRHHDAAPACPSGDAVSHNDNHRGNFSGEEPYYHHQERHHHRLDSHHFHNFSGDPSNVSAAHQDSNLGHSLPLSGQKRDYADGCNFVKLYVGAVPRTATEQVIRAVFGEYGRIVEVVLLRDKRTGLQQECCFVKYETLKEADLAIEVLHGQYMFPGGTMPIKVKYADGERERLVGSFGAHVHKLYIGGLNKQTSKREIDEVFSQYGIIEDIFIVRDEFKHSRGCAFIQYSCRDMAIAAIKALNGTYVMRGCDHPLIVRFADPKKPKHGDSRSAPNPHDPAGGFMLLNEMHQLKSPQFGSKPLIRSSTCGSSSSQIMSLSAEVETAIECDWSEHVSPDGDFYYYNCVTCESRWEKPEEYALYEQELEKPEQLQEQQQQQRQTSQQQQELDGGHMQVTTSQIVEPTSA